jgi:hypothetical protein
MHTAKVHTAAKSVRLILILIFSSHRSLYCPAVLSLALSRQKPALSQSRPSIFSGKLPKTRLHIRQLYIIKIPPRCHEFFENPESISSCLRTSPRYAIFKRCC